MQANGTTKLGLWMDQSHALVLDFQDDHTVIVEEISSPIEPRPRFIGEGSDLTRLSSIPGRVSTNEKKKNNIHNNLLKKYFSTLEKKIEGKEKLLLLGPGVTKTNFFHHLRGNKHYDDVHIQVMDADKMTQRQLLALVKARLST